MDIKDSALYVKAATKTNSFLMLLPLLALIVALFRTQAVFAMQDNNQTAVQARLKEAVDEEDWDSKAYDLIDALSENSEITPSPTTQAVAFDTLKQIYDQRIAYFQETLGQETDIEALQLLFSAAENNDFFNPQHQQQIKKFQRVANIEQAIFDSKATASYPNILTKLSAVQKSAEGQTFENNTKILFFDQITIAFNSRSDKSKPDKEKLKDVLTRGTTTPLLTAQQQEVIKGYLALLNLEGRINIALENPDFNQKVTGLQEVLTSLGNTAQDANTQQLLANSINLLFNQRPQNDPNALAMLGNFMGQAKDSPLLSLDARNTIVSSILPQLQPAAQSTQVAQAPIAQPVTLAQPLATGMGTIAAIAQPGQPGILLFEKELEQAMTNPTTLQKVDAVTLVMNKYFKVEVLPQAKNAFAKTLQTLFEQRYAPIIIQTVQVKQTPDKKAKTGKKKAKKKKKVKKAKKKKAKKKKTKKKKDKKNAKKKE